MKNTNIKSNLNGSYTSKLTKIVISASILIATSFSPLAQTNDAKKNTLKPLPNPSPWSLLVRSSYSQNAFDFKDGSLAKNADTLFWLKNKLSERITLQSKILFSKSLAPTVSGINSSDLLLGGIYSLYKDEKKLKTLSISLNTIWPTSPDSMNKTKLKYGIGSDLTGTFKPHEKSDFNFTGLLKINKYNYENEHSTEGKSNNNILFRQDAIIEYSVYNPISFALYYTHYNFWKFDGSTDVNYDLVEEINWQVSPTVTFSLGHSNSGAIIKDNFFEQNIQFVNEETSMFYAAIILAF